MLNQRQKDLLRLLLIHESGVLQVKDVAHQLGCGEKTVRNDLDRIETYLEGFPAVLLQRRPGIGISIECTEDDRTKILKQLLTNEHKTAEERLMEIAYIMLTSNKALTLQELAKRYYVSKSAIKLDMDAIAVWLARYDLQLVSKQGVGNVIQGTELKKRHALAHLSGILPILTTQKSYVLDLFLPYEISTVRKALLELSKRFSLPFTDAALESLQVHTLIIIKRSRQGAHVFVEPQEKERALAQKEYQYANWLFNRIEEAFRLSLPEEEKVYFTWLLLGSKRLDEETGAGIHLNEEVLQLVEAIIEKMARLTFTPFADDPILQHGLNVHMHAVINRIRFGFPITNPLLGTIKKMYPYIFNMVILTLAEIKNTFSMDIPEDEAAYIVLHFQAAVERMHNKTETRKKAIIVCHMGIGMSHLLEAKIEQRYQEIDILACIGQREMDEYLQLHEVDFIISTISLPKAPINHIVISPLFGPDDKMKLTQFIKEQERREQSTAVKNVISQFLSEALVFFHPEKEHRYEIVEMLARALFNKGYVDIKFIHSSVQRERKSATAIGGGVAIPHGDPGFVHTSAIAVALLPKPMDWGTEQVSAVFLLAISPDHQKEIRGIIGQISALSESPQKVENLSKSADYRSFLQMLGNLK